MSRGYVVGLPVAVTVHDDGSVTLDVDLCEIGDVLDNHEGEVTHAVEDDIATMTDAAARLGNCLTTTIHRTINL